MAVFEENWQKAKATIRERGIFMFNNDLLSDVSLVVRTSSDESEPNCKKSKMAIPAHKFVLSICSPVFFAMFCGKMAEKSDTIDLPDCEYEGVLEMLRYLYSEEVELNESNVMQVLYVAKKYILPSLAEKCIDFLHRNLDSANVLHVLSCAQQYDEEGLLDGCWAMIDGKTEEVVKSEGFVTIERSLLEAIVKRDTLNISEIKLFKAVDLWATKECERQGLAADGNVKRRILGEQIVKSIHFPAMEEKEFVGVVLDCKILAHEEVYDLMKSFNGVLSSPVGFPENRRVGTCYASCRFKSYVHLDGNGGWSYDEPKESDCLTFWVNEDVMLHGIRLFGSKGNEYVVTMTIQELSTRKTFVDLSSKRFSSVPLPYKEDEIDVFDVLFDPFMLRMGKKYVVKAKIAGPESCFGEIGANLVQNGDVTFHFANFKTRCNHSDTAVSVGQFADFFFRPLSDSL